MITKKPLQVFCCYARKDQKYLIGLKTHLKSLEREGLIIVKADIDIIPGTYWETTINQHLEAADIIILLITPDFVASDYCFNQEMRQAIARHEQGTACVIPVIIRPTDWHKAPFSVLQCLPKDGQPVSTWQNKDEAFLSITAGIRTLIQNLPIPVYTNQGKENPSMPSKQEDPSSASNQENYTNKYNFGGPVQANVIGDNTHIDNINNIYGEPKDGIGSLKKGAKTLWNKEYGRAKDELQQAVEYLDENNQSEAASQARYLLILALLGDKLPRSQGNAGITSIKKLMDGAIRLYPCASYYRIFARIYRNLFEATRSRNDLREAENFERKSIALPPRAIDSENMQYFQLCQPRLPL
jgi:TIR domain